MRPLSLNFSCLLFRCSDRGGSAEGQHACSHNEDVRYSLPASLDPPLQQQSARCWLESFPPPRARLQGPDSHLHPWRQQRHGRSHELSNLLRVLSSRVARDSPLLGQRGLNGNRAVAQVSRGAKGLQAALSEHEHQGLSARFARRCRSQESLRRRGSVV